MHKSVRAFKEYVMCGEIEHEVLKRTSKSDLSRSELEKIEIDKHEAAFKEKQSYIDFKRDTTARPKTVRQKVASFEGRIGK